MNPNPRSETIFFTVPFGIAVLLLSNTELNASALFEREECRTHANSPEGRAKDAYIWEQAREKDDHVGVPQVAQDTLAVRRPPSDASWGGSRLAGSGSARDCRAQRLQSEKHEIRGASPSQGDEDRL